MNRWAALLITVVGGGVAAQFLYMILGLVVFGVTSLFGIDDVLWNDEIASIIMFILLFGGSWVVCSWSIWLLIRRRGT